MQSGRSRWLETASPADGKKGVGKVISQSKMSKRARSELNKQKRVTWNFSPVTRVKPSKKIYNRKRGESYDEG